METYFENIKQRILDEFEAAEFIIYAAVAWVTDIDIINNLTKQVKRGINVDLVVNNDERLSMRELEFNSFSEYGGDLYLYPNDNNSIMHNKFCVIDLSVTITGSFNWSFSAARHKENIIIERENLNISKEFAREFKKIKQSSICYLNSDAKYNELAHYVDAKEVASHEHKGKYMRVLEITEGKKLIRLGFDNDLLPRGFWFPDRVFGYWTYKEKTIRDYEWWGFKLLDPKISKYWK